jgi:hypothetical protein
VAALLKPGGEALLCNESCRDGMLRFVPDIIEKQALQLEVVAVVEDVSKHLRCLSLAPGISSSPCTLVWLRRRSLDLQQEIGSVT